MNGWNTYSGRVSSMGEREVKNKLAEKRPGGGAAGCLYVGGTFPGCLHIANRKPISRRSTVIIIIYDFTYFRPIIKMASIKKITKNYIFRYNLQN